MWSGKLTIFAYSESLSSKISKNVEYSEIDQKTQTDFFWRFWVWERRIRTNYIVKKPEWQMKSQINSSALNSNWFGVSGRLKTVITWSVLWDAGMITDTYSSYVVNICKIKWSKSRVNTICKASSYTLMIIGLIFFGEQKYGNLFIKKMNCKQLINGEIRTPFFYQD